jgi:ribA/ribD-fused uncharacterized protein
MGKITSFSGPNRFLSNFWPAIVHLDGVDYPTVEHAYVAAKTLDTIKRAEVHRAATPGEAKRIGRKLQLRPDWDDVKVQVMADLLRQKFAHPALRDMLLATGNAELIEGNTWGDRFWGQCPVGVGENHLGRLLMELRAGLALV